MRYLLPMLALLAACGTDLTVPEDTPKTPDVQQQADVTFAPVAPGPLAKLAGCAGLPNVGSIVKVNSYPASTTQTGNPLIVTGDIIRDDASWPGVQNYCQDWNTSIKWLTFQEGKPYCLTPIEAWPDGDKHAYWIQHTCAGGPMRRAIAVPYNAAGTTIISTKRDTTLVYSY